MLLVGCRKSDKIQQLSPQLEHGPLQTLEELNKVISLGKGTSDVYKSRAFTFYSIGVYDYAANDFSRCIELGDTTARSMRGFCYMYSRQFRLAIEDFRYIPPWDSTAYHLFLAACFFALGEYDSTIQEWRREMETARVPGQYEPHIVAALMAKGLHTHALTMLDTIPRLPYRRGVLNIWQKKYVTAISDLKMALKLIADTTRRAYDRRERASLANFYLAIAYESLNNPAEADRHLQTALREGFPFNDLLDGYPRLQRVMSISPQRDSAIAQQVSLHVALDRNKILDPEEARMASYRILATIADRRFTEETRRLYAMLLVWDEDCWHFRFPIRTTVWGLDSDVP
jgi:tetratricopeptide (TPR) repeat protein